MYELRLILILLGIFAVIAMLLHGLWISKQEGNRKFCEKVEDDSTPPARLDVVAPRQKKYHGHGQPLTDPLMTDTNFNLSDNSTETNGSFYQNIAEVITEEENLSTPPNEPTSPQAEPPHPNHQLHIQDDTETITPILQGQDKDFGEDGAAFDNFANHLWQLQDHAAMTDQSTADNHPQHATNNDYNTAENEPSTEQEIIVLHVHGTTNTILHGTSLFNTMQRHLLQFGKMNIFHYHAANQPNEILFSVANMLNPGTFDYHAPESFTTQGLSFFMLLPCFGEAEQNFKLMLQTAQMIADDLGIHVYDDKHNLLTPNQLMQYRQKVRQFKNS